jgi:hypothetical protein
VPRGAVVVVAGIGNSDYTDVLQGTLLDQVGHPASEMCLAAAMPYFLTTPGRPHHRHAPSAGADGSLPVVYWGKYNRAS